MTFTAQDIALMLSTATTSCVAIIGVILPLWKARFERKQNQNAIVHAELRKALTAVVEAMNTRALNNGNRYWYLKKLRLAASLNSSIPEEKFDDHFDKQRILFEITAQSYGVSGEKITLLLAKQAMTYNDYWKCASQDNVNNETVANSLDASHNKSQPTKSKNTPRNRRTLGPNSG